LEYLDHFDKRALTHHFALPFRKLSKTLDFQRIKNN